MVEIETRKKVSPGALMDKMVPAQLYKTLENTMSPTFHGIDRSKESTNKSISRFDQDKLTNW